MTALSDRGVSYTAAFFMLIAFTIGGMIFGALLAVPILMVMTGANINSITDVMGNPVYFREMQVVQTVSALFGFLFPTLFTASRLSSDPIGLTGFKGRISTRQVVLAVLIMACAWGLSSALGYFSYQIPFPASWKAVFEKMELDYGKMAIHLVNLSSIKELIISVFVLAFIPAVCEETLFRGGFQNYLFRSTHKMWLSIIIVSLIFSAVHFSVYGFLSRFVLGIILGLIFHYSRRLWLSILAHFMNNAAAVLVMYYQKTNGMRMEDIMEDKSGSYIGLLALPILILLIFRFKREPADKPVTDGI